MKPVITWFRQDLRLADDPALVAAAATGAPVVCPYVAGSGAHAAPFFRVFNPTLQAEKFDPDGLCMKRWVPEAGIKAYPAPIIDLAVGRTRALAAFQSLNR
jgi:deoxyribodipyrimidine photo-lyase